MRKIILFVLLIPLIYGATYYTDTPADCPESDGTNFPGQDCNPNNICGDDGGIAQCYDTSTLEWGNLTSPSITSISGSYDGGGLVNCYATADGTNPQCSNGDGNIFWCDRASACYTTQVRYTNCTGFGIYECGDCRSGYGDCDDGGDVCEVQFGVTDYPTGTNNHYDDCDTCGCDTNFKDCDASGCDAGSGCDYHYNVACATNAQNISDCNTCQCNSGYYDCDDDDSDADNSTSVAGTNGCEVQEGGSCTVGGLTGTYSGCTCVVSPADIATTGLPVNWSGDSPMLWLNMVGGTGASLQINHSSGYLFIVNSSGAYYNGFDLSTDTTGSGSGNETTRVNAMTDENCTGTDKAIGFETNGTIVCSTDIDIDTNFTNGGTFEGDVTTYQDKRIYLRDSSQYIYSNQDNSIYIGSGVGIFYYIGGSLVGSRHINGINIGGEVPNINPLAKFDGEDSEGFIYWMEDEDYFDIKDNTLISASLNVTGNTTTLGYECHNSDCSSYTYHNGTHLIIQT